jgi:outer membrane lipoprotein SlyB
MPLRGRGRAIRRQFTGRSRRSTTPIVQGRNAQVAIHFDKLRLRDGSTTRIDGIVVSMQVKTRNNAVKEIGGAFLGMLAGNAIGKTLFGIGIGIGGGGIVGAAGGYMIAKDNRSDVVIPENTDITVRLVNTRRQAN